jgi:hypothetical protein
MATALKLRSDINKLKKALQTKGISDSVKSKLKNQLERAENELESLKKTGKAPKKSSVAGTKVALTALQKLIQRKKYGVYKGAGVDLDKDAGQGALATGKRISKGLKANQNGDKGSNKGNIYYEYRPNRLDVKQPKKKQTYPKLEDGGMMAKGGEFEVGDMVELKSGQKAKVIRVEESWIGVQTSNNMLKDVYKEDVKKLANSGYMADGGMMAKGGKLESGVYRIGKPSKVSQNLYEQKIVEIFDNGDIATASDYGRKMSDFSGNTYPIISQEQLEAQYKMAFGGYMAKGGETVPYIIWVSKDGEKREFYGDYKSQRAADMAMRKLWDSSDYKSMGNKPKKMYEKEGLYAKGGYMADGGMMAEGGNIIKGKRYISHWSRTNGEKNYDFLEIVDTNAISSSASYFGKVVKYKVFDSSDKSRIGKIEEITKDNLKKLLKYHAWESYADGGMMEKGGEGSNLWVIYTKEWQKKPEIIEEFTATHKTAKNKLTKLQRSKPNSDVVYLMTDKISFYELYGDLMAMGGALEHGLKVGDVVKLISGNSIAVYNSKDKNSYRVNISEGKREMVSEMNFEEYASGGKVKVGDTLTASTGVKVKVVEYDPMFGGRVKIERMDEYATGNPSQWMPLSKFKMADGGMMADKKFAVYAFDGKTNFFLDNEGNRSRVNYPSDIMSFDTTQEAIDFVKKHQYKYTYPLTWTTSPNLENTYSELNRDLEVYPISMMADGGIISKTHKLG